MTTFDPSLVFLEGSPSNKIVPIYPVFSGDDLFEAVDLSDAQSTWVKLNGFQGKSGELILILGENGDLACVLLGLGAETEKVPYQLVGALPGKLPEGHYEMAGVFATHFEAALYWGLGAYRFNQYKSGEHDDLPLLKVGEEIDAGALYNVVGAVYLGRDLINTPANDLGPDLYEEKIRALAEAFDASMKVVKGQALLDEGFPMIHAVGRAATQEPRLIELTWEAPEGKETAPHVTLVGKGICFDTGGLNLKPGNAMNLMKKDMGGSATALTIASMVMGAKLPINLRVLLPIAENNISGNAFRPGDVLPSRKGLFVEVDNTDAEGRLVLADALALADEEPADLLLCFATLTGAARVALGPDLPPFYTDSEDLADGIERAAEDTRDFVWRMPFWTPYDKMLSSKIADVNHVSNGPFAGSITAALFLRRFVENTERFAHFDIYGWTPTELPGKPFGGEPQTARGVFAYLQSVYGSRA